MIKPFKTIILTVMVGVVFAVSAAPAAASHNPWMESYQAFSEGKATSQVTVLSYVWAKGVPKRQRRYCRTLRGGFWNSGRGYNGRLYWFWDNRGTRACLVNGQWRKVRCGNPIRFRAPKRVIKGPVRVVRSFGKFKVRVKVAARVRVEGSCGFAEASAYAYATASGRTYAQARGNARVWAYDKAAVRAYVRASARLSCAVVTPPPPPPPGQHPPASQTPEAHDNPPDSPPDGEPVPGGSW